MPISERIPVPNVLNKGIASFQKWKKAFFQSFLFIVKRNRQKKANLKLYHCLVSSLSIGGLWPATRVAGGAVPCRVSMLVELEKNYRKRSLQKIMLFQSKLNELPEDVSLASKFRLTFQIQYFQVLIFAVFKCQFFREFPYQMA